jgi:predicted CXXCH cytochrome family protein
MAFRGKPTGSAIIATCARCHSDAELMRTYAPKQRVDQSTEYATSVHGKRLEAGDKNVATCASCHGAHGIRLVSDAKSPVFPTNVAATCARCHADEKRMAEYKLPDGTPLPTHQFADYQKSIHYTALTKGNDLSAPTCNDCHGNHGAAPPGVSFVGNVCGQCHVQNQELFAKSVHAKAFVKMGIPGCATCHSNHEIAPPSDAMLAVGEGGACAGCHNPEDNGGKTALEMRRQIDALRTEYDKAHAALGTAEAAGMEVSQPEFELSGAKTALVKARAAIHAFNVENVKKETAPGLEISAKSYAKGVKALDELQFRRKGLGVSVLIIGALIVGLVLKIRDIEKPK